jgi:hypothetical protein
LNKDSGSECPSNRIDATRQRKKWKCGNVQAIQAALFVNVFQEKIEAFSASSFGIKPGYDTPEIDGIHFFVADRRAIAGARSIGRE